MAIQSIYLDNFIHAILKQRWNRLTNFKHMSLRAYDRERLEVQSIPKYINFLILRLRDGYEIEHEERVNTYKFYYNFCVDNQLNPVRERTFYRDLVKRGIKSSPVYVAPENKTIRMRDLTSKTLEHALLGWVDNGTDTAFIVCVGNQRIQIAVRVTALDNPDTSAGQEI